MAKARLAERDQRRVDRLVRAAFGAERDPARRRDEQEARVLVAGVVEAIEAAGDERVVERPDREQPRAEQVAGEAGGGEHQEQVALGDAELDVLAFVVCVPFLRRCNLCLGEYIGHFIAAEQAALVDPGAEVGRDGDVGRGGDDPVGKIAAGLGQVEQDAAERGLGRLLFAGGRGNRRDLALPKLRVALFARERLRSISASTPVRALSPTPSSGSHSWPSRTPIVSRSAADLRRVHQPRVIVLVAGEGQAEALDRPGDEQGRHVVLRGVERLDQRLHAMAAEVGEQRRQRGVVIVFEESRRVLAKLRLDPRPPRRAALVVERRQLGVGQLLEPALERLVLRRARPASFLP